MEAASSDYSFELLCPVCGGFLESETPTGFCVDCTKREGYCITCGRVNTSPNQSECSTCRDQKWRAANADAIENYQLQGMSLTASMNQVRLDLREERQNDSS